MKISQTLRSWLSLSLIATASAKMWSAKFGIIGDFGDNNYPRGCLATIDENVGQYYSSYIVCSNSKMSL